MEHDQVAFSSACSLTIDMLTEEPLPLKTIDSQKPIVVSFKFEGGISCAGDCSVPLIVSMKLIMDHRIGLNNTLLEISPMVLRRELQESTSITNDTKFALSGESTYELLRTHYLETYGNRSPQLFEMTKGYLYGLYITMTKSELDVQVEELVWYTSDEDFEGAWTTLSSKDNMEGLEVMAMGEWCGFTSTSLCWHRYAVVRRLARQ